MNQIEQVQCSKQIDQVLTLLIDQVSSYINYLSEIKTAISNNKSDSLNNLLENQPLNPELIEKTQKQQLNILNHYGFETTEDGLNTCILACHNSKQLSSLQSTLKEKLKELENSLLVNSLLVKKGQNRVKQSIRILSGYSTTSTASSYSKFGHIENHEENKHSLAQA